MVASNTSRWFCLKTYFCCFNATGKTSSMSETPPLLLSKRFMVAIVLFLCWVVAQLLRNCINVTVIEMTSNKSVIEGNTTIIRPAEFNWDSNMVAVVTNIFAYGGLFSFFGGYLVNKFGGSVTCSVCMLISGIVTLLHPVALQLDFRLFLACRLLTGLCQAFFYVSAVEMYSRWFPEKERTKLLSLSFNGSNVGAAIAYPLGGYLSDRWGWQSVFYVTGVFPVIISVICLIIVKNKPSQDRRISAVELIYIEQGTSCNMISNIDFPYTKVLTSGPFWALSCITFAYLWIAVNLGMTLPSYVEDVTKKNSDIVGWISSIPSFVFALMVPFTGMLLDYCHNNSLISTTRMHKIMVAIAFLSATAFFVASSVISNLILTMGFFILIDILISPLALIIEINTVNLSPEHAGMISSLITFFLSLCTIVASTVTGLIISNHTVNEWNRCFFLVSIISVFGAVIYCVFGSSESQNWSGPPKNKDNVDISKTNLK